MPDIQITGEHTAGVEVIRLSGRVDSGQAYKLEQRLIQRLRERVYRFVVDLTHVEFLASSTLRILLAGTRKARQQGGVFVVCGIRPRVAPVFNVSGFDRLLQRADTLDDALDLARPAGASGADAAAPVVDSSDPGRGAEPSALRAPDSMPAAAGPAAPAARPGVSASRHVPAVPARAAVRPAMRPRPPVSGAVPMPLATPGSMLFTVVPEEPPALAWRIIAGFFRLVFFPVRVLGYTLHVVGTLLMGGRS